MLAQLNPNNVLVFYNRAGVNYDLGKYQNAISDYSRAIELFPDFANAYFNRSVAKSKIGNNAGAEEDYNIANEKVKKYKASSQEAYLAMADTSKKFNNLLEFDTDFGNGLTDINLKNEINLPTGFLPFIKLQVVDDNTKNIFKDYTTPFIEELNKSIQKGFLFTFSSSNSNSLKFSIDTSSSPKSIVYFIKASQLSSQNKYSQAIKEYEKSFKTDPNNLLVAFSLITERVEMARFVDQFNNESNAVSLKMGNRIDSKNEQVKSVNYFYNDAIDTYKGIAIELPELAVIPYNIGNTYILTEELDLASNEFTKAITIDPRFSEAWFNRGLIKLIKGEKQNGCADISKAGELGQNQAYSIIQKFCK
jgi:tetratricopeptide (TPR) repeat protein